MAQLKSTHVTGDLSVTGGLSASTIVKLGGTGSQVLIADGTTKEISSSNTVNALIQRDASGNFSANEITATKFKGTANQVANDLSINGKTYNGGTAVNVGTIGVAYGGTGLTAAPSLQVNLASTSAASIFAASPRPGVTGTLGVANGGTGATTLTSGAALIGNGTGAIQTRSITNNTSKTAVSASTNLITANTLYYHSGNSNLTTVGTISSGTWQGSTIGVAYGGTGMTSAPSLQVNLASTSATSIFAASPRPGVTGVLGVANGGTGTGTHTTNRIVWYNGSTLTAGYHYADQTHIGVGYTASTAPAYTLYVGDQNNSAGTFGVKKSITIADKATMQYDSTNEYMYFTFA